MVLLIINLLRTVDTSVNAIVGIFLLLLIIKAAALIALLFWVLLPWANTGYYLSITRLVRKRLKKDITEEEITIELRNIENVKMEQGILGRMFDYGDIDLKMTSGVPRELTIRDIKDPGHYKAIFDKFMSVPPPNQS